jgi:hypothetical protein
MTSSNKFSRRAVLASLGASAAMLPLLHAEKAPAAAGTFPKRLVTVTWTNGVMASTFYPTGSELTLGATLAPLEPYKSNRLLASLCNAMDVPVDSFGAAGYGGPLTELTTA